MYFAANGNVTIPGTLNTGDIWAARNATQGVVYLGSNGTRYIYNDGSSYVLPGQPTTVAGLTNTGTTIHAETGSNIFKDGTAGSLNIGGGTALNNGGLVVVRGNTQAATYPGSVELYTVGTLRFLITNQGSIRTNGVAATAASVGVAALQVGSEVFSAGRSAGLFFENRDIVAGANSAWGGWYSNTPNVQLYDSGVNIGAFNRASGAYAATSDGRFKHKVRASHFGLKQILALRAVDYFVRESKVRDTGFIAQEVRAFIPTAVVEMPKGMDGDETILGLNTTPIIAALVKAVQELEARIAALEAA
jgi:hypothetical protein